MPRDTPHNSLNLKLGSFFQIVPPHQSTPIWVRFFNSPSTFRNWPRRVFLTCHLLPFPPAPQTCRRTANTVQPESGSFFQISSPARARLTWVRFSNSPSIIRNWLRSVFLTRHLLLFASARQNWLRSENCCLAASPYRWVRFCKLTLTQPSTAFEALPPQSSPFLRFRSAKNALSSPFTPAPRTFPRLPTSSSHAKLFLINP
jgi:hypothetical protein